MSIQSFILLIFIFLIYLLGKNGISKLVGRIGQERNIDLGRIQYVNATINVVWTILALASAGVAAGVGYKDLGVFFGSALAVLGIALFAQWSILSNVTASVVVFFFFPYRVGNHVQILDAENSVAGQIKEITLFHVILIAEDNTLITYPNSMVFQKAVKITPPNKSTNVAVSSDAANSDTQ